MKRLWKLGGLAGIAAAVTGALATGLVAVQLGGASASAADETQTQGGETAPATAATLPSLVAVAIGDLEEDDGGSCTVDLRGSIRNDVAGGALRFYCEDVGYYNGGVRTLTVDHDVIRVAGGGGLIRPDGTRALVRYTADVALDGSQAVIHVQHRNGEYTLEGPLDGFIHVFTPSATS